MNGVSGLRKEAKGGHWERSASATGRPAFIGT